MGWDGIGWVCVGMKWSAKLDVSNTLVGYDAQDAETRSIYCGKIERNDVRW